MSRFVNLLSTLPEGGMKGRIMKALDESIFTVDELRASVAGRNIEQATTLFKDELSLSGFDASALAGLLVHPTGNYIPISQLIILQALTLFLYIVCVIASHQFYIIYTLRFPSRRLLLIILFLYRAVCFEITLYFSSQFSSFVVFCQIAQTGGGYQVGGKLVGHGFGGGPIRRS
jgi:hypothetical protein